MMMTINTLDLMAMVTMMMINTLDCIISGARYSGVPHKVQVRSLIFFAKPKSVIWRKQTKSMIWNNFSFRNLVTLRSHWTGELNILCKTFLVHVLYFWRAVLMIPWGAPPWIHVFICICWSWLIPWGVPPCPGAGFLVSYPWSNEINVDIQCIPWMKLSCWVLHWHFDPVLT